MSAESNEFCTPNSTPSHPKWTSWNYLRWKYLPAKMGGGRQYLLAYKDSWILFNKSRIHAAAKSAKIPTLLLAGVAWIEVGGDPDFIDSLVFPVRSFDWSGPGYIDNHFTVTRHPHKTSFGSVSIQLRRAAKTMGINLDDIDYKQQAKLCRCLQTDWFNLNVVAKHLHELIKYDFPDADSENLTDVQIAIAGSRYNRGTERTLEDLFESLKATPGTNTRQYTDYGRTILRHKERLFLLLMRGR